MQYFYSHEKIFLYPPYSDQVAGLSYTIKMRLMAGLIISLVLVDHFLYVGATLLKVSSTLEKCEFEKRDALKVFFVNERQILLTFFKFHKLLIPFLEVHKLNCFRQIQLISCNFSGLK